MLFTQIVTVFPSEWKEVVEVLLIANNRYSYKP
jgi:hypothetical protein